MPCVLAGDLGSSSLRLALIDPEGHALATASVALPAHAEAPGWSEADPVLWWTSFAAAAASLARQAPDGFAGVAAIAICGMTRSQVLLDAEGEPLRPAILWADTRAAATLPALRACLPEGHPETAHVNAFHPIARLCWLRQHDPSIMRRLATVVEPKDYLNLRLTGELASDPVSMARMLAAATPGPAGRTLLAAAGLDPKLLPRLVAPASAMGRVRSGLDGPLAQLAGRPVLAMAHDTWASAIGLGAMRPGFAYNIAGTSEVLGVVGARPAAAEGLMTIDWTGGLVQLGGPSQAGGDTLVWLLSLLGCRNGPADIGPALAQLASQPRSPAPLLFLPYLQGERTPYWDANLRGAFVGLGRRHGPADLLQAVMEGVAFLNRIVLKRAAATGLAIEELRCGGGGAANAPWCQIKADILGCDVVVPAGDEHGLIGAAIAAWTMLGRYPGLAEGQQALARPARRYRPDPAQKAHYDRLFSVFRDTEAALRPISHRLADWRQPEAGQCAK